SLAVSAALSALPQEVKLIAITAHSAIKSVFAENFIGF
ncbi:MAG: hypothetical protein ACI959_001598, partial [Limisphaerales bacterium]